MSYLWATELCKVTKADGYQYRVRMSDTCWLLVLKGHSGAELHIYFLVHLESIYYEIFFYSKIVPNCAVAK